MVSEYKCLFYKDRICHVREYLKIADENLREDMIMNETRERTIRQIQDVEPERLANRYVRNTADWLVNEFCQICPHREA